MPMLWDFLCFGNLSDLRAQLDTYARTRLCLADFEPVLNIDAELALDAITPDLFETLRRLEPFGAGNPEPVFCATARLSAPAKILKEKHVRLKLAPGCTRQHAPGIRRALVQPMRQLQPNMLFLKNFAGAERRAVAQNTGSGFPAPNGSSLRNVSNRSGVIASKASSASMFSTGSKSARQRRVERKYLAALEDLTDFPKPKKIPQHRHARRIG